MTYWTMKWYEMCAFWDMLFIRREISCRNQGLEIIDPTADAVVFGDANLSFALNLARHRRSDASNSRFSRKG